MLPPRFCGYRRVKCINLNGRTALELCFFFLTYFGNSVSSNSPCSTFRGSCRSRARGENARASHPTWAAPRAALLWKNCLYPLPYTNAGKCQETENPTFWVQRWPPHEDASNPPPAWPEAAPHHELGREGPLGQSARRVSSGS